MTRLLLLPLLAVILAGCQHKTKDPAYYVRAAHEQQSDKRFSRSGPSSVDQRTSDSYLLNLEEEFREEWQRLPWETVDDWMERIQNQLALNHSLILELRAQQDEVVASERTIVRKMQTVIAQNEQMRDQITELTPVDPIAQADLALFRSIPPPTFRLHLVRKGDTLYSIARYYYSDPSMIQDIMLWNQGWLRNPHQLLAGMALVIFDEEAGEKNEQVVEEYLRRIPAYQ